MNPPKLIILLLGGLLLHSVTSGSPSEDPWVSFRPLLGQWTGAGSGFGNFSDVTHEWEFVVQGHFLRLQTKSVPRDSKESPEIHEDIGFLSHDTDRSVFVFRQFLSEGFVNTFEVTVESGELPKFFFSGRESESAGGMRVQIRLVFLSADEYKMELDLAAPGKEFSTCQQMQMKRVK